MQVDGEQLKGKVQLTTGRDVMCETKLDYEQFKEKVQLMTGRDVMRAQREEIKSGHTEAMFMVTYGVCGRLASYALNVNLPELEALPASQYTRILQMVFTLLNAGSETEDAMSEK